MTSICMAVVVTITEFVLCEVQENENKKLMNYHALLVPVLTMTLAARGQSRAGSGPKEKLFASPPPAKTLS